MTVAIVGHGIDLVDVARFAESLDRTPGLRERLFAPIERTYSLESLAARFAAKEALVKALGSADGLSWVDIEIPRGDGVPKFHFRGESAATIAHRDVLLHLTLSHDAGFAVASVIAESR